MSYRKVTDFFKPPAYSISNSRKNSGSNANSASNDESLSAPEFSHHLDRSSSPPTNHNSSDLQLFDSLAHSVKDASKEDNPERSYQSTEAATDNPTFESNSSHRVVRHGKEMVISSDGEDTESIASLADPDELFKEITRPNGIKTESDKQQENHAEDTESRPRRKTRNVEIDSYASTNDPAPKYKFTLDSLVSNAADDREVEAQVAELKSTLAKPVPTNRLESALGASTGDAGKRKELQKDLLTSALDDGSDEVEVQRLYDAIQRTEAFDHEKTWNFFDDSIDLPPPEFPLASVAPTTYVSVLREPASRERALHSGLIEFSLSRNFLPDEFVTWIFHSVPCEPRDDLRQTYCRVFKRASADRIRSLIRPNDIDDLFRRLGARPIALALSETIAPESPSKLDALENRQKSHASLLSVLDLLRSSTDLFADDTREHIFKLLCRLEIDTSLVGDGVVCSELERTITAVFESTLERGDDSTVQRLSAWVFDTVKDPVFQSRILTHILPTSDGIALFRCRLAIAFLVRSPAPLTERPEEVLDLKRITGVLRDKRFDAKMYKGKQDVEFDYDELAAVTTFLNVAINPRTDRYPSAAQQTDAEFNEDVDVLAERIKKIFSSIVDTGASHLKRTQVKEGLEALHYRIIYSVRTKPPPKKGFFEAYGNGAWDGAARSSSFMEKFARVGGSDKTNNPKQNSVS